MKIGIFFGGQSREREISFAVVVRCTTNLNKSLFEAGTRVRGQPGQFYLLNWEYIYKGHHP
jgi:D-alanine-D-alanine ligase